MDLRVAGRGKTVTVAALTENRGEDPLVDLDVRLLVPDGDCVSVEGPDRRHRGRLGAAAAFETQWRVTSGSSADCGAQVVVAQVTAFDKAGSAIVKESDALVLYPVPARR